VNRRFAGLLASVVVLCSAVAAGAAPQAVVLELKGQPGDAAKYATQFSAAMDMTFTDPATGRLAFSLSPRLGGTAVTIERVVEVTEEGALVVGGQVESFDFSFEFADLRGQLALQGPDGGPPQLIRLPMLPIYSVVSPQGKPLAIRGLEHLPIPPIKVPGGPGLDLRGMIQGMIERFSQPLFPDRPVSVGDTWEWEMVVDVAQMLEQMGMPMPEEARQAMALARIPLKNTSRLVRFEQVGGVECAVIEAECPWELTMQPGVVGDEPITMSQSGATLVRTWFDYQAGRKVREQFEYTFAMRMGTAQVTPMRMEMQIAADSQLR